MASLADAVTRRSAQALTDRMHVQTRRIRALDADALARSLDALDPRQCDCAVIVASDEPSVQAAVDSASRRGIVVMTLVSDLPETQRRHFIGIDNRAAGRTAASLLGRFLPQGGKVAVVAGSLHLRDHSDRLEGFRAVLAAELLTFWRSMATWRGSTILAPAMPGLSRRWRVPAVRAHCVW
jgi:LacI family transcriptional regulator